LSIFDRFSDRVEGFLDEVFIPEGLRSNLEQASQLLERGDYGEAETLLERALDEHAEHHRTSHLLGLCYFFRDAYTEALEQFEEAIELRDEPASRLYAGLAAEQLGAARDAKLHFQAALSSSESPPFEFDLHFGHGRALLELDRPEKAVHELEKAERLGPREPEVHLALARALVETEELEVAAERLDDVGEVGLSAEGLSLRAEIAQARGEHARAASLFERALERSDGDGDALTGAARNHLRAGAPARAQQYLLELLEVADAPDARLDARVLLGRAREKVGELDAAHEAYASAVDRIDTSDGSDLDSDRCAEARLGYARTSLERGDLETAEHAFDDLVPTPRPDIRGEARLGLARCRIEAGLHSEARRLLEEIEDDQIREGLRAERHHLTGRAALGTGDAATALVAIQEALHRVETPADEQRFQESRLDALRELKPDWDLPGAIDGPVAAERALEEVRDFITSAPRLEAFAPRSRRLVEAMNRPLSVAVVGEFNAGKSTLVNALLGEEVLPTGVLPTTAHTCYIQYGPRKTARVHYRNDAPDDWDIDVEPGEILEVNFEEARRRMEEHTDRIDHLEFLYPHPQLRSIHFRDTPGFNALEEGHDVTAADALEDAEAILWVFDAKQTLTRTEFDRLTEIPESADRLVLVLNKIDALADEDLEELEAYVDDVIGAEIAGAFPISAKEAIENARTAPSGGEAEPSDRFEAFRDFLESRFVQRAGHIKTLEVQRRLRELVDDLERRVDELVETFDELQSEADELAAWLEDCADSRPEMRTEREADTVSDQFQFAVTAVAREIREDLRPRGTFFSRMVLDEEDRAFALELLEDRLNDVLVRSQQRVDTDIAGFENELDARLGSILDELAVPDARSLDRRLEGLHDEFSAHRRVLDERVYGQLAARIRGRIDAAGASGLAAVESDDPEDLEPWREPLERLLPDAASHINEHLTDWYGEFFLAAHRFCHRVQSDLQLIRLETEYRYDSSPLRELLSSP